MAEALPDSTFLGLDLSEGHVAAARVAAAETGLRNSRAACGSTCWRRRPTGPFDYVLAHGVFSWAAEPAREVCWPCAAGI